jgi:hypothetical protein
MSISHEKDTCTTAIDIPTLEDENYIYFDRKYVRPFIVHGAQRACLISLEDGREDATIQFGDCGVSGCANRLDGIYLLGGDVPSRWFVGDGDGKKVGIAWVIIFFLLLDCA